MATIRTLIRKPCASTAGSFHLGLASGFPPEKVTDYLPYVDCFLVATGISKSFTELDPAKVAALVERVRGYAASP